jgi:hypothetical protein
MAGFVVNQRRPESSIFTGFLLPAFAGMTMSGCFNQF